MLDPNSLIAQNMPEAQGTIIIEPEQIELTAAKFGVRYRRRQISSWRHYQSAAERLVRRWGQAGKMPGIFRSVAAAVEYRPSSYWVHIFVKVWKVKRN